MKKFITSEEIEKVKQDTIESLQLPKNSQLDYINDEYLSKVAKVVDLAISKVTGHNVTWIASRNLWNVSSDQNGQDKCGTYILQLPNLNWVHSTNQGYCAPGDVIAVFVRTH